MLAEVRAQYVERLAPASLLAFHRMHEKTNHLAVTQGLWGHAGVMPTINKSEGTHYMYLVQARLCPQITRHAAHDVHRIAHQMLIEECCTPSLGDPRFTTLQKAVRRPGARSATLVRYADCAAPPTAAWPPLPLSQPERPS